MSVWATGSWTATAWAVGAWTAASTIAWDANSWDGAWRESSWIGMAAPVPVPDSDYAAWLKADNQLRIVLVEVEVYSGGIVVTRYLSDGDFVSKPTDTPPNRSYTDGFITGTPQFSSRLSELFTGQSTPSWGDFDIHNFNGELDSWLDDAWDGRVIRVYLGSQDWPKSQFQLIHVGTIDDIYAKDQKTLALKVRDKKWLLNVPAQTNLMGGTTANKDQPIPLCYGPNKNVEPVLKDASISQYQVHDGEINAITQVRDSGVSVAFTADLATGTFVLTSAAAGRITADVQGAKPGGVYLTKCSDIVRHLVLNHSILTTSDLNATNLTAFNTTCPQTLGLYVRDRENLATVIDNLIISVGGWYDFSRTGLLEIGRLDVPATSASVEFMADDVSAGSLRVIRRIKPPATIRLGFEKNWTIQMDGLAGAVTEAKREEFKRDYLVAKASNPAINTAHLLAPEADLDGTLLVLEADAVAEADRRLALHGQIRKVYGGEAFAVPFSTKLGQTVNVTHPSFGFSAGRKVVVVGLRESPTKGRVEPELWA